MAKNENLFSKSRQKQTAIAVAVLLAILLLVVGLTGKKSEKMPADPAPTALSKPVLSGAEAVKATQKADSLRQAEEAKVREKKEAAERLEAAKLKAEKEAAAFLLGTLKIGDEYGGGIVFFVDAAHKHGMIAAKTDLPGPYFTWEEAKKACEDLVENGYSDWYLPSKDELDMLYFEKSAVGGFESVGYWSSTELSEDSAWFQLFGRGYKLDTYKFNGALVRPVRAF